MKKCLMLILAFMLMTQQAMAVNLARQLNVSASVNEVLVMDIVVRELDAQGDPIGADQFPNIPFGTLQETNGVLTSPAYGVFVGVNTSSREYEIKAQMNQLADATGALPDATVLDIISATDGVSDIVGDSVTLGARNAKMTSATTIYTSNSAGQGVAMQLNYAIAGFLSGGGAPFTGYQPVPAGHRGGTFTSTLTLDLVLTS